MTSIIKSNRERKSRLDEGLVERLNSQVHKEEKEIKKDIPEITDTSNDIPDLKLIGNEKRYNDIVSYIKLTFPDFDIKKEVSFENGEMRGNIYTTIMTDMYFKSINSKYRVARLIEMEKNPYFFDYLANVGIANAGIAVMDNKLIRMKIADCGYSPVFIDLRGLELDKKLIWYLTDESRYTRADWMKWPTLTGYSKIDDFGLPTETDENSRRKVLINANKITAVRRSSDLLYAQDAISHSIFLTKIVLCKVRP